MRMDVERIARARSDLLDPVDARVELAALRTPCAIGGDPRDLLGAGAVRVDAVHGARKAIRAVRGGEFQISAGLGKGDVTLKHGFPVRGVQALRRIVERSAGRGPRAPLRGVGANAVAPDPHAVAVAAGIGGEGNRAVARRIVVLVLAVGGDALPVGHGDVEGRGHVRSRIVGISVAEQGIRVAPLDNAAALDGAVGVERRRSSAGERDLRCRIGRMRSQRKRAGKQEHQDHG